MDIKEELIEIINKTLDILYEKEKYLFDCDASERNLVFHFGRYFIDALKEKEDEFKFYNVDYEYNRDKFNEKVYKEIQYADRKYRILPDLILHERGSNDNNILAIEFKKYSNNATKETFKDYLKLSALTDQRCRYKYKLGLFIKLGEKRRQVKITRFENGKKI